MNAVLSALNLVSSQLSEPQRSSVLSSITIGCKISDRSERLGTFVKLVVQDRHETDTEPIRVNRPLYGESWTVARLEARKFKGTIPRADRPSSPSFRCVQSRFVEPAALSADQLDKGLR